jgi:CRISPR-associated protein Cas2
MLVLVTYDVNTETRAGEKRLRLIAKECVKFGQRVQNSVFECSLDAGQYKLLKATLLEIMDSEKDSLRFYNLGKNYQSKIEHHGCKRGYDAKDTLIV